MSSSSFGNGNYLHDQVDDLQDDVLVTEDVVTEEIDVEAESNGNYYKITAHARSFTRYAKVTGPVSHRRAIPSTTCHSYPRPPLAASVRF